MFLDKVVLGCAQFDSRYGVFSNEDGISVEEKFKIIETARVIGIKYLDTAHGYGESEATLGRIGVQDFNIITKLPVQFATALPPNEFVNEWFSSTCEKLRVDRIHTVLFHRSVQLRAGYGGLVYNQLKILQDMGKILNIGVSIYNPEELELIWNLFEIDTVQAPMNVFDNRLETSGWLEKLKMNNVHVHIRSIFLQGVLLRSFHELPQFFEKWAPLFRKYDQTVKDHGLNKLEFALSSIVSKKFVDAMVVGVQSSAELIKLKNSMCKSELSKHELATDDLNLIIPSRWNY